MPGVRLLTAELSVDGAAVSGFVIDELGRRRRFDGWLELIAVIQTPADGHDEVPSVTEPPPA